MFTADNLANIAPQYLPQPHASLLNGIVLGISIKHTGEFYKDTIDSGLIHLAVVSGSNVALLNAFIQKILSFLPKNILLITIIFTNVLFLFFIGIQPPVTRAVVMSIISVFGLMIGRSTHTWYVLFISGLLLLLIMPNWVSSLSFFLTYLSTTGIILFAKPSSNSPPSQNIVVKVWRYIYSEIRTGIAAQVFIWPVILIFFGRISFISVITTFLVSWTILPIMILGFLMIFFSNFNSNITTFIANILIHLLGFIIRISQLFS